MDRIDLHTHSTCSDGTCTPTELVDLAVREGLRAFSLTDHDTTAGLDEAFDAGARAGIEVIPGCEISTSLDGRSIHVLAHGFPPGAPRLESLLEAVRAARVERNARMLERLAELSVPLTHAEVEAQAAGRIVARPHFAKAMVARGYVPDFRAAFDRYLKDGGPAYVVVERIAPADAVRAVRDAGGAASVAHPRQIALETDAAWREFFGDLVAAGLAGIEVDHPSHAPDDRAFFAALADDLGLLRVGGSDFHGANKANVRMGVGNGSIDVRYDTWERLRARRREPRG